MILMYVSVSLPHSVDAIAELILKERLANHVNIVKNSESMVWKDGQIVRSDETILLIKTKALLYANIERAIKNLRLKEKPKMFSVPITQIDFPYHEFLIAEVMKV